MDTTWDGLPVARERPFGAAIIVYRDSARGREWLILHRKPNGAEYEGEWAWTPPSGARYPDESVDACARRELKEETGLDVPCSSTDFGSGDWAVYYAVAPANYAPRMDLEHDRYLWATLEAAVKKCLPDSVGESFRAIDLHVKDLAAR